MRDERRKKGEELATSFETARNQAPLEVCFHALK
jgi:hypothetical protein